MGRRLLATAATLAAALLLTGTGTSQAGWTDTHTVPGITITYQAPVVGSATCAVLDPQNKVATITYLAAADEQWQVLHDVGADGDPVLVEGPLSADTPVVTVTPDAPEGRSDLLIVQALAGGAGTPVTVATFTVAGQSGQSGRITCV